MKNDSGLSELVSDLAKGFFTAVTVIGAIYCSVFHATPLSNEIEHVKASAKARIGKYSAKSQRSDDSLLRKMISEEVYRFDSLRQPNHIMSQDYDGSRVIDPVECPSIYIPSFPYDRLR